MHYTLDHSLDVLTVLPEHIPPSTLACMPAATAQALQVLPIKRQHQMLQVAMVEPLDWNRLQQLRILTGCDVQAKTIGPALLKKGLSQFYPHVPTETTPIEQTDKTGTVSPDRLEETNVSSVVQLVDQIMTTAVKRQASDIHIEPFDQTLRLRYRIDGFLQSQPDLPWKLRAAVVSRIKVLANLDIAEKRRPQDGKIRFKIPGQDVDLRVSTTPTLYGEKVVLRVLNRATVALDLKGLGLGPGILTPLYQAIARPYGLVLVTGPTGSGKTTTLYAALNRIRAEGINILTVEDPIEYNLAGVNQTQVHAEIGLTFAQVLRSFLRQDPNVILVGEIRDSETAEIAIQAALTGHLVLSSVHTNDAAGAVGRLLDMGIEPFLVASSLSLVLAQRLIRRNCIDCKHPVEMTLEEQAQLNLEKSIPVWQGAGCEQCYHTGYRGRAAIAEIMPVSHKISTLISRHASAQEIQQQASQEGMHTLYEDGLQKLTDGLTTPSEILRETVIG